MGLIKKKISLLILLSLFYVTCSAQEHMISCGHEQTSCCTKKTVEFERNKIYEFEKDKFELKAHNAWNHHLLLINNKEYLLDITLDLGEIFLHFFNCQNKMFIFIHLDDYYSSMYYVLLYESKKLYNLGIFFIREPNVEDIGPYEKDFDIQADEKHVSIQILLNGKLGERIEFSERELINKKQ